MSERIINPNDFKVVVLKNSTDFTFTPEMGCMYDGRPIFGITGAPGINGGESMTLPYHVGHRLAVNLAKIAMMKGSAEKPQLDAMGQPIIKAIWDSTKLEEMKNSYLTELYTEDKPIAQTETDRLMAKVEELNRIVMANLAKPQQSAQQEKVENPEAPKASDSATVPPANEGVPGTTTPNDPSKITFTDKADVIAELEKRNIPHDKRKSKEALEKLLA